jgi:hypothetical protein
MARTRTTQQTTRIKGARVILKTTTNAAGETKVTVREADVEEWVLQAAAIRALRAMPEYSLSAGKGQFTLAGDFNSARRSPREQMKAKATGLMPGEHDIRIYIQGGQLGLIEMKAAKTPVSAEQKKRHALLSWMGFTRQAVLRATSEEEAEGLVVETVRGWLAEQRATA